MRHDRYEYHKFACVDYRKPYSHPVAKHNWLGATLIGVLLGTAVVLLLAQ